MPAKQGGFSYLDKGSEWLCLLEGWRVAVLVGMAAKEFDRGSTQGMASLIDTSFHLTSEPEGGGLATPPASTVTVGMWRPSEQHAGSRAGLSARCLFRFARLGLERGQQEGGQSPPGAGRWVAHGCVHWLFCIPIASSLRETEALMLISR